MLFTAAQEVAQIDVEVDEAVSDDATDEIAEQAA